MELLFILVGGVLLIASIVGYVWSGVWVVRDAKRVGKISFPMAALVFLFGPIAALGWWLTRPKELKKPSAYADAQDASRARELMGMLALSSLLAIAGVVGSVVIAHHCERIDRESAASRSFYGSGGYSNTEKDTLVEPYLAFRWTVYFVIFVGLLGMVITGNALWQHRSRGMRTGPTAPAIPLPMNRRRR